MHLPNEFGLIIILLIVVVLFGGGRIAKVGGELGSAIREFRKGLSSGDEPTNATHPTEDKVEETAKK